ncbi:hypothetical protein F5Y12DRAFT_39749 [Xylaria sp. FL1777]|nr:hypothetical protein F5Y12DRAFT_39749 [Xylaria sp. FL1777]
MLRQLWAWCRNPRYSLTSSLTRSSHPQPGLAWQRHFFSPSGIARRAPRFHQYHQNGSRSRQLRAHIHTSIYMSITALVLNDAMDIDFGRAMCIRLILKIADEKDPDQKWRIFCETIQQLLSRFSDSQLECHEGAIRVPSFLETRLLTAPDPEVEGGTLVVFLGMVKDAGNDPYLIDNGRWITNVALTILPEIEAFASGLESSPKVRGVALLLEPDGSWKSLYWDGKRWMNVLFLEWQDSETLSYWVKREWNQADA